MCQLLLLLPGDTTNTSTADTDSCTKLRWIHHHQPQHASACLGVPPCGAAMMMTPSFV
jgi:hypothetical protein